MEWVGRRRAGIVMRFDPSDAQVLRGLVTGVRELVGGDRPGRARRPADPLAELTGLDPYGPDTDEPDTDEPDIYEPDTDEPDTSAAADGFGRPPGSGRPPGFEGLSGWEGLSGLGELAGLGELPGGEPPRPVPPRDPALARLLPDGYIEDDDAAAEFRSLTESSLRRHKSETAQRVLDSLPEGGGRVCLDEEATRAWLTALNDIRLVIGTRLDVTEEMDIPEPTDPRAPGYELYRWLTLLQELLVEATIGEPRLD